MLKPIYHSFILSILLLIFSCSTFQFQHDQSGSQAKHIQNNPLIIELNETIKFENIQEKDIRQATDIVLRKADAILDEILTVPDSLRTFENTMLRLDDLYNLVSNVWSPLGLLSSVSNIEKIREASDESSLIMQEYFIELIANESLYQAVLVYSHTNEAQTLNKSRKRFLESELKDFKHTGFYKIKS